MMMMLGASDIAREYPASDARRHRLTSVRNGQGLPGFGRSPEEEGGSVVCVGDPVERGTRRDS